MRVNDLLVFTGNTAEVSLFITYIKVAITMNCSRFLNDLSRVCYMCSFMTGFAFAWAQPYLD
ncbi:hypothetical protein BJV82DRAFT_528176, partial [Fennellomyces sp. T-0311]